MTITDLDNMAALAVNALILGLVLGSLAALLRRAAKS